MKIKKKQIIVLIFILMVTLGKSQNINLIPTNGPTISFELNRLQKITFNDQTINFKKDDGTYSVQTSTIRYLNFSFPIVGEIEPISEKTYNLNTFPNPADDYLNIPLSLINNSSKIEILSIDGKILYSENIKKINSTLLTLDISFLKAGIYIICIDNSKERLTSRLIKK